ncbi:MAG: SprT family zinc-dependent metalloprotease, partial [Chloroflexota bacterium]
LTVVHSGGVKSVVHRKDGVLRVSGPAEAADEAIDRWYRREARTRLEEAVARHAEQLGIRYERVTIRDQRTRWGSCSTRGTLSFSWRLVLAPPEVLEYVVVHELLHVREANHSRAFWHLLDVHRPGWKAQAQWLRTHGHELLAYSS